MLEKGFCLATLWLKLKREWCYTIILRTIFEDRLGKADGYNLNGGEV